MSDRTITEDDIRREHSTSANQAAHWAYLSGVVLIGLLLMLALIAVLGGATTSG